MTSLGQIESILRTERYTQGFNAVPVYLNRVGYSGIVMEHEVGVRDTDFAVRYQRRWAEWSYVLADFERIWQALREQWLKNSTYFVELKQAYDQRFAAYDDLLRRDLPDRLASATDPVFMTLLDRARRAMVDVGVSAHVTEAISWGADKELRTHLGAQGLANRALDEQIATLTIPAQPSWVAQEQQALERIQMLPKAALDDALQSHLNDWYWMSNSYAGRQDISIDQLTERLTERNLVEPRSQQSVAAITLQPNAQRLVDLLRFITTWHDERKANVLRAIDGLSRTLDELAVRTSTERALLDYLTVGELDGISFLTDIKPLVPMLLERISGVWSLIDEAGDTSFSGANFGAVDQLRADLDTHLDHADELHGNTANPGKVEGPVALCLSLDSIASFPAGAVLVTSITRPEFMVAIRRAAAIVTDEGGITCHAAIVARELGKPCIIGTKVATKVLRNGELVEVNANHGIIRRIKSAIHSQEDRAKQS